MTRKTYYMPQALADDLEQAISQLREDATGNRVPRAVVLAEIIRAGLSQAESIAARLEQRVHRQFDEL